MLLRMPAMLSKLVQHILSDTDQEQFEEQCFSNPEQATEDWMERLLADLAPGIAIDVTSFSLQTACQTLLNGFKLESGMVAR